MKRNLFLVFLILGISILSVFIFMIYTKNKNVDQSFLNKQECTRDIANQRDAIQNDQLAKMETFQGHKITDVFQGTLANLNITNDVYVKTFRTRIQEELKTTGINFAGHYSIVKIRLTGGPDNYYIVDRINGKADIFPYDSYSLEYEKDSNLIIINPKEKILAMMSSVLSGKDGEWEYCNQAGDPHYLPDLRSFYVLLEQSQVFSNDGTLVDSEPYFQQIGPHAPPISEFWSTKGIFR